MTTEQKPKPWQDRHPPCPTCGTPERMYRNPAAVGEVIEAARVVTDTAGFLWSDERIGYEEIQVKRGSIHALMDALAALDQEPEE